MKQRIKLKGRLKAYLQTAIVLGIVLAGVNVGIYFLDIRSGAIVSLFLVIYFVAMQSFLSRILIINDSFESNSPYCSMPVIDTFSDGTVSLA